jgi:hypothetical protein
MILYSVHPLKPKWNLKFLYNWQSVRLGVERLCGAHDQILFIISHRFIFVHQSSLAILYQQSHPVVRQEKHSEEITVEFYLRTISYILVAFRNMPKIFRHGAEGFTSPPKKACCGFLSPLKIHRLRPSVNLRTSGPMVSMLTTISPRVTLVY